MNTNPDIQADDVSDETNAVQPGPPRSNPHTQIQSNNSSKMENDDDDVCKCGDPSSHQFECALFCGQHPCWDKLVKLPKCDHYLHEECLEQLLYTRMSKCPLCRSSVDQWRRTKHYQHIEEEIAAAFRGDTDLALELSKKLFEEEQRKKKALENKSKETAPENSERSRLRDRDRNRNSNSNRNSNRGSGDNENSSRSEEGSVDIDRGRRRDRGSNRSRNRFRSFFNRARSRSRSRHRGRGTSSR